MHGISWRRRNHSELYLLRAVRTDTDGDAFAFQRRQESRIFPRAVFDVLPGEQFIFADSNFLKTEAPISAGGRRLEASGLFARRDGNKNDCRQRLRTSPVVEDHTFNGPLL